MITGYGRMPWGRRRNAVGCDPNKDSAALRWCRFHGRPIANSDATGTDRPLPTQA